MQYNIKFEKTNKATWGNVDEVLGLEKCSTKTREVGIYKEDLERTYQTFFDIGCDVWTGQINDIIHVFHANDMAEHWKKDKCPKSWMFKFNKSSVMI